MIFFLGGGGEGVVMKNVCQFDNLFWILPDALDLENTV